ncbi:MAG: caspase family protein [Bacteroidota bacterium]
MKSPLLLLPFLLLYFLLPSALSAQCVSGDCQDGKGTYRYPSGAKYVGEFEAGEIHGLGVCYYTNGSKYSGQWEHRYPNGKGTKTYPDGTKWTGQWKMGKMVDEQGNVLEETWVAKGEEADDGTNIQSGCISGDCVNGRGVFAYADGSKYEGEFVRSRLEGQGTFYYPNGDKYVGAFRNNYSHGKGVFFYADGTKTAGEWVEGEYYGETWVALGKEGCVEGDCTNGEGTYVYRDGAAKYTGRFRDGLASGRGVCHYAEGEYYEGEWDNGSFNGLGILHLKDGREVAGNWSDGTFLGPADVSALEAVSPSEQSATPTITTTPATVPTEVTTSSSPSNNPTTSTPAEVKVWAVVIGIAAYSHMPVLRYTDDDAYRMYAFLKSPEGGALSDDQIRVLVDEDATKAKITETMAEVFGQAGPNDLVLLYFSGHGLKGSFLPIDFDGYNNKLFHDEINTILSESPAKYKLCIADACHSGSLFAMKSGTVESALANYYKTLAQAEAGTALIMSSKSSETSLESSGLRQGVFSHFLIRGLKGEADRDDDKIVSVQELYDFIHGNVRDYTGMRQSPVIQGDYDPKMTVAVKR